MVRLLLYLSNRRRYASMECQCMWSGYGGVVALGLPVPSQHIPETGL